MAGITAGKPLLCGHTWRRSVSLWQQQMVRTQARSGMGFFHPTGLILAGFTRQAAFQRPASINGPNP
jgi:hypothetical protein